MEINGRHYSSDEADLRVIELQIAVSKLPPTSLQRLQFEFLFGYIQEIRADLLDQGKLEKELSEANTDLSITRDKIAEALQKLGVEAYLAQIMDLGDAISKIVELTKIATSKIEIPVIP